MTFTPLLICTICYVLTAIGFFRDGQVGMGIAFTGYTLGNVGFLYISVYGSRQPSEISNFQSPIHVISPFAFRILHS